MPGSLIRVVLQELHKQLWHVGEKKMVEALSQRYWRAPLTLDTYSTAIAPLLQPKLTGFPGERVGTTIMGPLPLTKREKRYMLVMVDYFTKVADSAELCKTFGTAKTHTTPGNQQGNRQVEKTNRTLIGLLQAFTKGGQPGDWDLSLGCALPASRATVHASTGVQDAHRSRSESSL
ncbi:unnamed protein product [Taenia asiatica]|uniref:Integrase catalytic domain-containing protein n=1 Tax=Taenia asiatica TaxID=60517 RepID=A0A0R3WB16_TAEAS|nr:unnamed protein product [Taenia asiatica]